MGEMLILLIWCAPGLVLGWAIGHHRGRPLLGLALGCVCGLFGVLLLFLLPKATPQCPACLSHIREGARVCYRCGEDLKA